MLSYFGIFKNKGFIRSMFIAAAFLTLQGNGVGYGMKEENNELENKVDNDLKQKATSLASRFTKKDIKGKDITLTSLIQGIYDYKTKFYNIVINLRKVNCVDIFKVSFFPFLENLFCSIVDSLFIHSETRGSKIGMYTKGWYCWGYKKHLFSSVFIDFNFSIMNLIPNFFYSFFFFDDQNSIVKCVGKIDNPFFSWHFYLRLLLPNIDIKWFITDSFYLSVNITPFLIELVYYIIFKVRYLVEGCEKELNDNFNLCKELVTIGKAYSEDNELNIITDKETKEKILEQIREYENECEEKYGKEEDKMKKFIKVNNIHYSTKVKKGEIFMTYKINNYCYERQYCFGGVHMTSICLGNDTTSNVKRIKQMGGFLVNETRNNLEKFHYDKNKGKNINIGKNGVIVYPITSLDLEGFIYTQYCLLNKILYPGK